MYINKTKYRMGIGISLLLSFILTGCSVNNENTTSKQVDTHPVKHELGETNVPDEVNRIVTLELGLTETTASLGIAPVGVADDDKPERIAKKTMEIIEGYTSVGTRAQPNLEIIRTLNPDLIIADPDRHESIYEELNKIAPTVAFKDDTANYETVKETTMKLGETLNKKEKAESLIASHEQLADQLKTNMSIGEQTVLQAGYNEGNLFSVSTSSAFLPGFLHSIGTTYALQDNEQVTQEMTIEQLLKINPDILIVTVNEEESSVQETLKDDPLWSKLTAVKNNQVYEVGHNDWSRRRTLLAIEDISDKMNEILTNTKTEITE